MRINSVNNDSPPFNQGVAEEVSSSSSSQGEVVNAQAFGNIKDLFALLDQEGLNSCQTSKEFEDYLGGAILSQGVDARNHEGWTALMLAIEKGNLPFAQYLLEKKADINAQSAPKLWTALHVTIQYFNPEGNSKSRIEIVKFLISNGAALDLRNYDDNTSLSLAALYGQTEIVRLLIKNRADINSQDIKGDTPLMLSIASKHIDCAKLLIEKGADTNLKNKNNATALSYTLRNVEGNLDLTKLLVENGANVNATVEDDAPILLCAILLNNKGFARILIENGADTNVIAQEASMFCALLARDDENHDFAEMLIANGANISDSDIAFALRTGRELMSITAKHFHLINRFFIENYLRTDNLAEAFREKLSSDNHDALNDLNTPLSQDLIPVHNDKINFLSKEVIAFYEDEIDFQITVNIGGWVREFILSKNAARILDNIQVKEGDNNFKPFYIPDDVAYHISSYLERKDHGSLLCTSYAKQEPFDITQEGFPAFLKERVEELQAKSLQSANSNISSKKHALLMASQRPEQYFETYIEGLLDDHPVKQMFNQLPLRSAPVEDASVEMLRNQGAAEEASSSSSSEDRSSKRLRVDSLGNSASQAEVSSHANKISAPGSSSYGLGGY